MDVLSSKIMILSLGLYKIHMYNAELLLSPSELEDRASGSWGP